MQRKISLVLFFLTAGLGSAQANEFGDLPPRAVAALQQGQAAEQGSGIRKNFPLAVSLYCDAAQMGSPEGFFRVGRILAKGPAFLRKPDLANAYLALAIRLGHQEAARYYDEKVKNALMSDECGDFMVGLTLPGFDLDAYLAAQPLAKRKIAELIRRHAPRYNVDVRVALSVALAESNLDSAAVSPKNAQGVMQLIPITQQRFGVKQPFDAENNVHGGLSYLKWLKGRFGDDWSLVAAAYNSGEGAVTRYKGIPPYTETRRYVQRVLYFAGLTDCAATKEAAAPSSLGNVAKLSAAKKTAISCANALKL
jgi:hypothetical protein